MITCGHNARIGLLGGVHLSWVDRVEKTQGVATLFYSLRTMNIALLHERTSLTTKVWIQSLSMC